MSAPGSTPPPELLQRLRVLVARDILESMKSQAAPTRALRNDVVDLTGDEEDARTTPAAGSARAAPTAKREHKPAAARRIYSDGRSSDSSYASESSWSASSTACSSDSGGSG